MEYICVLEKRQFRVQREIYVTEVDIAQSEKRKREDKSIICMIVSN